MTARLAVFRTELEQGAEFLRRRDHPVTFIGEIASGKTTYLAAANGLMLPGEISADDLSALSALETGESRTTLPEVHIEHAPGASRQDDGAKFYEILVEGHEEEWVRQSVYDYCESVVTALTPPGQAAAPREVPEEVARCLRNMADLTVSAGQDRQAQLLESMRLPDEPRDKFVARLAMEILRRIDLPQRQRTRLIYEPDCGLEPLPWLKRTFADINNGRLRDVPVPRVVTVRVPDRVFAADQYDLRLIDTRGIHGPAPREDVMKWLENPRTLVVLCSRFPTALDTNIQALLAHAHSTLAAGALNRRVLVLVLARPSEARKMRYDDGMPVRNNAEGYDRKRQQMASKLAGLPEEQLPVEFINVVSESPEGVNRRLLQQLSLVRDGWAERIKAAAREARQLVSVLGRDKTQRAYGEVTRRLSIFLKQHSSLTARDTTVYVPLLNLVTRTHPASVWASTRRKGEYESFNVYFLLGEGTAQDVKVRSECFFEHLRAEILSMTGDERLEPAHGFLHQLGEQAQKWRQLFLGAARLAGRELLRPPLARDEPLWAECQGYWGNRLRRRGERYVDCVSGELEGWFAEADPGQTLDVLDQRVNEAWQERVLKPMEELSCTAQTAVSTK